MAKILGWEIQDREKELRYLNEAIQTLEDHGFQVSGGELPTVRRSAEELLNNSHYDNNPIIQRMRRGEKLESIVADISSKRKYNLKFKWNERKNYNKSIEDLSEVIPGTRVLKRSFFLDIPSVESFPVYAAAMGYAIGKGLLCLEGIESPEEPSTQEFLDKLPYVMGVVGAAFGIIPGIADSLRNRTKNVLSNIKDYVRYVDTSLGRNQKNKT